MIFEDGDFESGRAFQYTLEDIYSIIDDERDYRRVLKAVYGVFYNATVPARDSLLKDELHFMFGPATVARHDIGTLAAKAAFCATHSYIVTPYTLVRSVLAESDFDWMRDSYVINVSDEFIKLLIELKPYILDGCISIIPKSSTFRDAKSVSHVIQYVNADNTDILNVLLREEASRIQRIETTPALKLSLQTVTGPRGQDVIKVKSEHQEELEALHRALSEMLSVTPQQGETAVLESMRIIEDRAHNLNDRLHGMRRKDWFEAMKLSLTPLPVVMPLLLPQPFGTMVAAAATMLGGSGVIQCFQYGLDRRNLKREIESDPFFVPWLLPSIKPRHGGR
jgi:hypothetical protein